MQLNHFIAINRRGLPLAVVLLALSLSSGVMQEARSQNVTETDPSRCAIINLAHYYLICADINTELHAYINQKVPKDLARATKIERESVKITKDLERDFISAAYDLYAQAGRKLTPEVVSVRMQSNKADVKAALEEYAQRVKQQILGERAAPKPNMFALCTQQVLGAEIRDQEKLNRRFNEYVREANQLLQKQKSCIK